LPLGGPDLSAGLHSEAAVGGRSLPVPVLAEGVSDPSSAAFGKIGDAYAPWRVWLWLNGHTWAQQQCQRLGIGYTALDNGFRACDDPEALQRICDGLSPGAVKSFFWRWQRRLPSPLTRDDLCAGYVYELAFRQFEISNTRVFDRPAAGRSFFEQLIRDHLDVGRPQKVSLVFDRRINRRTPGTFRTQVITGNAQTVRSGWMSLFRRPRQSDPALMSEGRRLTHRSLAHRSSGRLLVRAGRSRPTTRREWGHRGVLAAVLAGGDLSRRWAGAVFHHSTRSKKRRS
jgi:hypothetical protein